TLAIWTELHGMSKHPKSALLDDVRRVIRAKHMAWSTEKTYVGWIYRFILYHDKRHPLNLKEKHVQDYLTYLANERFVAVATQNQALQSILFLYREVLDSPLDELKFNRSRRPKRLPTVLNREEVIAILTKLDGEAKLMVSLLYGCGLRQNECLSLRYQDLDLERMEVTIRGAKGNKDRNVTIPDKLKEPLQLRLNHVKQWLKDKLEKGDFIGVSVPPSIDNKFPSYKNKIGWQFLFSSESTSADPIQGKVRWYYRHNTFLQRALRRALEQSGVAKKVTSHTFRHSYATHILESGCDIRTLAHILGHSNIKTTMIYLHVLEINRAKVKSPLDNLF
ncbi:MAG: integron integrase, partial [Limisphaerales bacterium]